MLFLAVTSMPNLAYSVHAQRSPVVAYAPSFAMPLPAQAPGYVAQPAPVSGRLRVLVIAATFSDVNSTVSIDTLKQEFFGQANAYFQEISYGAVSLTGDIYGWYKLPHPQSYYGRNCGSMIDDPTCSGGGSGSWQIARDVVPLAEKDVNFASYDYFVFIHSGYGEESSKDTDTVWSVTFLGGVEVDAGEKTLYQFSIVPELETRGAVPVGVYCHEFLHLLDIPDLFNTYDGAAILGPWSTMDKGTWNGNPPGSSPAHLISWGKIQLGFIKGSMLAAAAPGTTTTYTIDPTEVASSNVHAVEIPVAQSSNGKPNLVQYYLVEVRQLIGFDSALPASGVLISYVNNNAVVGKIHIMDGHPSVPGLEDATWDVGQTFTDSPHNIVVLIMGKIGSAYQVAVATEGSPLPPIQNQKQNQTSIDLALTGISAQPAVVINPNVTVTITAQISNLGNQAVTAVPVEVDLDGQLYQNTQVSIGADSTTQTSFTWTSTLGSHVFKVTIDPNRTLNDTNWANNVATFTLNIGPTLTINMPPNVTANSPIWVSINGTMYNATSGQLRTSVPAGTITVQIEPVVNTSVGVRQLFTGWSDGNQSNPRRIFVNSNTTLLAVYVTQYLLSLDPSSGSTTPSEWYTPNTVASISANSPSDVNANTSRLIFSNWSGDIKSTSNPTSINITKPFSVKANWITQYYVTVISPTGTPTGSGWYNAGAIASVSVQSTVYYSNGARQVFTGWNPPTLGNNPKTQLVVNVPEVLQAAWETQYQVNALSNYGEPVGSGWYDVGSTATISVQPEVDYGNATRRVFLGWSGDYQGSTSSISLQVTSPKTVTAKWATQYQLTFGVSGLPNATVVKLGLNNSTYDLTPNNEHQGWYTKGTTLSPTLNQSLAQGFAYYNFAGWKNSTGASVQEPIVVNGPQTFVGMYSSEMALPPLPGFPTEATLLGILLGLLALILRRRKKSSNGTYK